MKFSTEEIFFLSFPFPAPHVSLASYRDPAKPTQKRRGTEARGGSRGGCQGGCHLAQPWASRMSKLDSSRVSASRELSAMGSVSQPRGARHLPGPPDRQAFLNLSRREHEVSRRKGWVPEQSPCALTITGAATSADLFHPLPWPALLTFNI